MPPGFFFCHYSYVLTLEHSIEKHDQGVERDAWLFLNLSLDFHAHSND